MAAAMRKEWFPVIVGILGILLSVSQYAPAHCDTMDGPVIADAKRALEKGEVSPVLKWVNKGAEAEIKDAFQKALTDRGKGADAKERADMRFFETLVRVHRAGEGVAYEGIKPAGTKIEPGIEGSDKALETGSADDLIREITDAATEGIRERFARALETRKHKDESVEAGREFVESYVAFMHYVERLHQDAASNPVHHGGEAGAGHAEAGQRGEHAHADTEHKQEGKSHDTH